MYHPDLFDFPSMYATTIFLHFSVRLRKDQAQGIRMNLNGSQERGRRASYASSHGSVPSLTNSFSTQTSITSTAPHRISRPPLQSGAGVLPAFVKPTPTRIPAEDLEYLTKRGALALPAEPLRSELLNSHFNFVHPFMPLLNRREFLDIVTCEDGSKGKVSLLLLQAVMFTGSAVCFPPCAFFFFFLFLD